MDNEIHKVELNWLRYLRCYIALIALLNVFWEMFQMPLYTMWNDDTSATIIYSIIHCTIGDILIALVSISLALVIIGNENWPQKNFIPVAALAIIFGEAYCFYSEWLNVYVHHSWAYSENMPLLSIGAVDFGATPLLQWLIIPPLALWLSRKIARAPCN